MVAWPFGGRRSCCDLVFKDILLLSINRELGGTLEEIPVWPCCWALLLNCSTSPPTLLQGSKTQKAADLPKVADPLTQVGLGCAQVKTGLGSWFSAGFTTNSLQSNHQASGRKSAPEHPPAALGPVPLCLLLVLLDRPAQRVQHHDSPLPLPPAGPRPGIC